MITLPTENKATKADAPAKITGNTEKRNQQENYTTFSDAISATLGVQAPQLTPGQIVRFGEKNVLWALMFIDSQGVSFGNWTTGEKYTHFAQSNKEFSREDIALSRQRAADARRQRDIETQRRHAKAAQQCTVLRAESPTPDKHSYLIQKQIEKFAGLFGLHTDGRLITYLEHQGRTVNAQYIRPDGEKRFHYGGQVTGACCVINRPDTYNAIIICEGVATGCTLAMVEPDSLVLAAMNAGNLLPVARVIRADHPDHKIVIAGDDDRNTEGNPGKTKAIETARAIDGEYALPEFPPGVKGTDFNDLYCAGYFE